LVATAPIPATPDPSDVGSGPTDFDPARLARVRLPFIANRGQVDPAAKFYAATFAGTVFVTDTGLTYALTGDLALAERVGLVVAIRETFVGGAVRSPIGLDRGMTVVSVFARDPSSWRSGVPVYNRIAFTAVWPGVDVELRAYGHNVEKLFTVMPGGAIEDVRLAFEGVLGLAVDGTGRLLIETPGGTIAMTPPVAYQDIDGVRTPRDVTYVVHGTTYGFAVGPYDLQHPLVIDPLLASTFIGGGGTDLPNVIALDPSGNVFITGVTRSVEFPATPGSFDTTNDGDDLFITKFDADLSSLLASTFIGGASPVVPAIAVDASGNVYLLAEAGTGYPVTSGAYDTIQNGGSDLAVSKFDNGLTSLLASTYLGGFTAESPLSILLDGSGDVFVMGRTLSGDYPTTAGAFDPSFGGSIDIVVSKLNADLTALLASTFLGAAGDVARSGSPLLAIDPSGNLFATGSTQGPERGGFPTTSGAFDTTHAGFTDGFVSKLSPDLTALLASTFLGGSSDESSRSIAIDPTGSVFVTGGTSSFDFPTTVGAYDRTMTVAADAYVAKFNNDLTALSASTLLGGGASLEWGNAILREPLGNVLVSGVSNSPDFPTTTGAYDTTFEGAGEAFIARLDSGLTSLLTATLLGGTSAEGLPGGFGEDDEVRSMILDASGDIYVLGWTRSADFPTTENAYDETFNGIADVFVTRITKDLAAIPAVDDEPPTITCPPDVLHFASAGPLTSADIGTATASDNSGSVTVTNDAPSTFPLGVTTVTWTATDPSGNTATCIQSVTVADDIPPTLTVPANIVVGNDPGQASAVVTYTVTASDNAPGVTVACSPPSGSVFPLGTTTVMCEATDASGNMATASFDVTIVDVEPPDTTITSATDDTGDAVANGGSTLSPSITFAFGGTDNVAVASFQCSLDGAAFAGCTSPQSFSGLSASLHDFQVRAVDTSGNIDPTPTSFMWTILTAAQAISSLIGDVEAMGLPQGVENSLTAPLKDALKKLTDKNPENDKTACSNLKDFIDQVNAKESNGQLTVAQASQLREAAEEIQAALGCS
jgi:hypothetical protein